MTTGQIACYKTGQIINSQQSKSARVQERPGIPHSDY